MTQPTTAPEKTAPRPRGRPAKLESRELMSVYLTPADKAKLQRLADAAGLSMSTWVAQQIRLHGHG